MRVNLLENNIIIYMYIPKGNVLLAYVQYIKLLFTTLTYCTLQLYNINADVCVRVYKYFMSF